MGTEQRIEIIRDRLQKKFHPTKLDVLDDSEKHRGHAGSQNGAGHYTIKIVADCFIGQPRISVHREIYTVLADLIPHEIHALQIIIQ